MRPTRAEIDLAAIAHNAHAVLGVLGPSTQLYGVVKADGYGHGAVEVAHALASAGVQGVCVALVEEGMELRAAGITLPVLVMSGVYRDGFDLALRHGLTPVVYDPAQLPWLHRTPGPVRVHLKIDTGMARLGVTLHELPAVLQSLADARGVVVEGLMTHFANADCDDPTFTHVQMDRFREADALVRAAGFGPLLLHAANSAAAFRLPDTRLSLARVGIALYGVAPFPHGGPALLPAMKLRTEVISVREVPPGSPVGYAGAYRTGRRAILATLPVGYADGFFRRLSSEAEVLIRGARAQVVGNVSMDLCTVDVTNIARAHGVSVGDEAVLLGSQRGPAGFDSIRAEEIAQRVGTIAYEVLTAVSRRVPRAYLPAR